MSRCHNCGRETMRTEDWACQWCGYPLVSGSFRKIEKTYGQLKEERLRKPEEEVEEELIENPEIEEEPLPELETGLAREVGQIESPEPETEKEPEKEEEPVLEPEECVVEEEPLPETKTEEEIKDTIEIEKEEEKEAIPEEEIEVEAEPEPVPEAEPGLEPAAEELHVTELFKAYDEDDVAADERFVNKILRITGVVSLVDAKNVSDTHYIRLAASEGDLMQSVQCMFHKKHASSLSQLEKGQVLTVQGRYNGSVIAMRMVDCVLVV